MVSFEQLIVGLNPVVHEGDPVLTSMAAPKSLISMSHQDEVPIPRPSHLVVHDLARRIARTLDAMVVRYLRLAFGLQLDWSCLWSSELLLPDNDPVAVETRMAGKTVRVPI